MLLRFDLRGSKKGENTVPNTMNGEIPLKKIKHVVVDASNAFMHGMMWERQSVCQTGTLESRNVLLFCWCSASANACSTQSLTAGKSAIGRS